MAKSNKKKSQNVIPAKRRVKRKPVEADSLDVAGAKAAHMYADPCGADLVPTVYPGERGYVNRFVLNTFLGATAGATASAWIWKPGNAVSFPVDNPLGTTATTIAYGNSTPGNTFLVNNSSKQRCAGFCIDIRPISSPNNVTGTIYFGVANAASLPNGLATTVNDISLLCSESVSCSQAAMAPLSVKWCPGGFDDRYSPTWAPGFVGDDDSDRNVLIIAAIGFPAGTGFNLRVTAIYEWSPKTTLGVMIDGTSVAPSKCDKDCLLRNLKRKDADWWWSLGRKAINIGKDLVAGYYTGGAIGVMGGLAKYTKF